MLRSFEFVRPTIYARLKELDIMLA